MCFVSFKGLRGNFLCEGWKQKRPTRNLVCIRENPVRGVWSLPPANKTSYVRPWPVGQYEYGMSDRMKEPPFQLVVDKKMSLSLLLRLLLNYYYY